MLGADPYRVRWLGRQVRAQGELEEPSFGLLARTSGSTATTIPQFMIFKNDMLRRCAFEQGVMNFDMAGFPKDFVG